MHVNINMYMYMKTGCPEVFSGKDALKICSKFTGDHPCRRLLCNFI